MAWYRWDQNNTGGHFDVDGNLCHRLFIEADTYEEAEQKALDLGVYYNGCEDDLDCPCCGDRWYSGDEVKLQKNGTYKYTPDMVFACIEDYVQYLADEYGWTDPDARMFYADGDVQEITGRKC